MDSITRFHVFRRMLADLGTPIRPDMKVLDFGCGEGRLVKAALAEGFDAYGCDLYDVKYSVSWTSPGIASELREHRRLRPIESPYRLPFEDSSIDVVISDQVFEHVLDYPQAIAELQRITRVGGVFLHAFPSRYRVMEGHIYVPMTSMFKPRWWLWVWALLGVRNEFQHGLSARDVVDHNAHFLEHGTKYLPPDEITREFSKGFGRVRYVERVFLPYSVRPKLLRFVPFGPELYGLLWNRFLYGMREVASPAPAAPLSASPVGVGSSS
jgi:SAM-dependent methyltransferase